MSHDLEDVLNVVDGRPALADEVSEAPDALRNFVRERITSLLKHPDFSNALPGLIADADRTVIVMARLRAIAT